MSAAVFDRSPRGLVVVLGDDATAFLQSLISQDLDGMEDGHSRSSLLLTPQGKLDVLFRITRVGDAWWLDTEADYGPRLAQSLTRFRIRVKAEIDDRSPSTGMLSFTTQPDDAAGLVRIPTDWGVDLLGDREVVAQLAEKAGAASDFEAFRIEHGIPKLGVDIDEKTIPQEAFLERDAVSLTKGCFLGQELVARIDSRGHVNRHLRRLQMAGAALPPRGAIVVAGDKEVGAISSAAASEGRVVALGMVRREVEPPADVTVRLDGTETPATVLA
jgi:tRNA-modifying protein YgfZ